MSFYATLLSGNLRTPYKAGNWSMTSSIRNGREFVEQRSAAVLIPDTHELHVAGVARWRPIWKQRLVVGTLIMLDTLLAVLIWGVASVFQGLWSTGTLSDVTVVAMVPVVAVWVGLRAMLGLYPGYGVSSVEELFEQKAPWDSTLADSRRRHLSPHARKGVCESRWPCQVYGRRDDKAHHPKALRQ